MVLLGLIPCVGEEVTAHISLPLSVSVWVLLSSPIERPETRLTTYIPEHGRYGERRSPKVQPLTSWQSEILSTVPTSHTYLCVSAFVCVCVFVCMCVCVCLCVSVCVCVARLL